MTGFTIGLVAAGLWLSVMVGVAVFLRAAPGPPKRSIRQFRLTRKTLSEKIPVVVRSFGDRRERSASRIGGATLKPALATASGQRVRTFSSGPITRTEPSPADAQKVMYMATGQEELGPGSDAIAAPATSIPNPVPVGLPNPQPVIIEDVKKPSSTVESVQMDEVLAWIKPAEAIAPAVEAPPESVAEQLPPEPAPIRKASAKPAFERGVRKVGNVSYVLVDDEGRPVLK